jgi:hypothetical protein
MQRKEDSAVVGDSYAEAEAGYLAVFREIAQTVLADQETVVHMVFPPVFINTGSYSIS